MARVNTPPSEGGGPTAKVREKKAIPLTSKGVAEAKQIVSMGEGWLDSGSAHITGTRILAQRASRKWKWRSRKGADTMALLDLKGQPSVGEALSERTRANPRG